jgi:hypothetical protein
LVQLFNDFRSKRHAYRHFFDQGTKKKNWQIGQKKQQKKRESNSPISSKAIICGKKTSFTVT